MSPAPNCRSNDPWRPRITKGSIVVPRTSLLRAMENLNSLMRSKASRNAKLTVWGQLMALEEIYAEGFKRDDSFAYSLRSKLYPYSDHMRRAFVWLHIDPLIDAIPLEELRELTAGHELILAHQRREDL